MKFRVTVKKGDGPEVTKSIEAESRFAVYGEVQKEGARVVAISERVGFELPKNLNITIGTGVKRREIITVSKNLSAMLKAGLSLARGLSILERQTHRKGLKNVITDLLLAVTKGSTFHEALATHPKVFSRLYVAMTRAGEESGGLAESLLVIGTQMERSDELARKVKGAMIYPAIVITAIVAVGILMLIFVVPTLTETFKQLNVEVPLATRIITALSDFLVANVILVLIGIAVVVAGSIVFARSERGKNLIVRGALYLPVVGVLVQETYAARTARTLASLLTAAVPVLDAIAITEEVAGTRLYADVLAEAGERVKKGDPLSAAFIGHPKVYPIMMSDMIAVGEETGKLSEMLLQVAEFYEGDVSQKTKDLSTIIEPVLMLVVGAMVGVFAVSMIAPIYSLSEAL